MSVIPVFISFISVAVRPSHNMRIRMKSPHRPGISPMVFFCGPLPVVSFLRSSFAVLFLWFPFCGLLLRSFSCGFLSALSLLRPTRAHIRQSCNGSVHATIDIRFLWLLIVHPQQSTFCGSSPFQVCTFSTDLAHPSPPEAAPGPVPVPGLHLFDRPGTDEDINMKRLLRYLSCRTYILFTPRHNK